MQARPLGSRALLLPGPQPPLSHFGATLLRHVVTAGLRFALHSIGAPMPEGAPVRIVRLRLYLDRAKLSRTLTDFEAADELLGALIDPGGRGSLPGSAASTRGAIAFHRTRLRLRPTRTRSRPGREEVGAGPARLWSGFRAMASELQPALSEALLGEILASLHRRARRSKGREIQPCLGRQAAAMLDGRKADLSYLGLADPFAASWSESPAVEEHVTARSQGLPRGRRLARSADQRHRGEFREAYRKALNPLRSAYLLLATDARDRGVIEEVGDAFFLPFDLAESLAAPSAPDWLPQAVASNRAEYQRLLDGGSPPESFETMPDGRELEDDRDDWVLAPLWPLA